MSLASKQKKAKELGIELEDGKEYTEEALDALIQQKQDFIKQQKDEEKIRKAAEKRAAEEALKNKIVLKDVDGHDVDQADYFWPRTEAETINGKTYQPTTETAPGYFNKICGYPVDDQELIDVFVGFFPRAKEFLFYKTKGKEVYLVIVPLKYATTISRANESRPGDFQRHALSFIAEGSVNVESLKLKLARIQKHTSISTEPIAR
jgi:hypothetical protein